MKRFIVIMCIVFGLVACSNDAEYDAEHMEKTELLEKNLEDAKKQLKEQENEIKERESEIEVKENEISRLLEENIEINREVQDLRKAIEEHEYPYYVSKYEEVYSEGNERLISYAFILKGIANRSLHIDKYLESNDYTNDQIKILEKEREYVWQLWLDWKDKETELMREMEYIDG